MPTFSGLKTTVFSALIHPHETSRTRSKRRVISFNEAFNNLKNADSGIVTCAAFHYFGKCRKEISLNNVDFPAHLNELSMSDVQTPIKLMPFMLCANHWEKTVYYNALFLDWLSIHGSKHNSQYFENIVIDYQSAVTIENEKYEIPVIHVSPESTGEAEEMPTPEPSTSMRDDNSSATPSPEGQSQTYFDNGEVDSSESDLEPSESEPQASLPVTMDVYASLEFGVAKIEIVYQDNLKCIAMSSDGWRCPEIISQKHFLEARDLVMSSAKSNTALDIELLLRLTLCPGHAIGQLPDLYLEKWARFSAKRLTKDAAMSMFKADFWISVSFFGNETAQLDPGSRTIRRLRSSSSDSTHQSSGLSETTATGAGGNSQSPPFGISSPFRSQSFQFGLPLRCSSAEFETAAKYFSTDEAWLKLSTKSVSANVEGARSTNIATQNTNTPIPAALDTLSTSCGSSSQASTVSDVPQTASSAPSSRKAANVEHTTCDSQSSYASSHPLPATVDDASIRSKRPSHSRGPFRSIRYPARNGLDHSTFQTYSQDVIDRNLITAMIWSSQSSCIYIRCLPDIIGRNLLTFDKGISVSSPKDPNKTMAHLVDSVRVNDPERVMRLVYAELANFRADTKCYPRPNSANIYVAGPDPVRWYDVDKDVAIASIRLWRDFTHEAYDSEGDLKYKWEQMMPLLPEPSDSESEALKRGLLDNDGNSIALHHDLRNSRYRQWFKAGLLTDVLHVGI